LETGTSFAKTPDPTRSFPNLLAATLHSIITSPLVAFRPRSSCDYGKLLIQQHPTPS
jgi:hypothetical protein